MRWPDDVDRALIDALAARLGFSAIRCVRDMSGLSGARTFLCTPDALEFTPQSIVVKIGPAELIEQESSRNEQGATQFRLANHQLTQHVVKDGQGALALGLAGEQRTERFQSFYEGADPARLREVLEVLFVDRLRMRANTTRRSGVNPFLQYEIEDENATISALGEVGDAEPGLVTWWKHAADCDESGSHLRLCHGDLHAGNILVGERDDVFVVDFTRTASTHAWRDLAKLARDFALTLYRPDGRGPDDAVRDLLPHLLAPAPADAGRAPDLDRALAGLGTLYELATDNVGGPDDAREYAVALLAQFLFAAQNELRSPPERRAALLGATYLRKHLEATDERLVLPAGQVRRLERQEIARQLAYGFIRLDQLPSGGWSRTLWGWMASIWDGDDGAITRNRDMRTVGGTDITSVSLIAYIELVRRVAGPDGARQLLEANRVAESAASNIEARIGFDGGIGVGHSVQSQTPVRVRHTAMGLLALLYCDLGYGYPKVERRSLQQTVDYLLRTLPHCLEDRSYPFGMFAVCAKLCELIDVDAPASRTGAAGDLFPGLARRLPTADRQSLVSALREALVKIREALVADWGDTSRDRLRPTPPDHLNFGHPFFRPYQSFWRMERAGLLMYLRFLVGANGQGFVDAVDEGLQRRIHSALVALLAEVATPFDPEDATQSMLPYCRAESPEPHGAAPRDWGLSAELASVLTLPAIRSLLGDDERLADVSSALVEALTATFDQFEERPELFKFTQSLSFGRLLDCVPVATLSRARLSRLDSEVTRALRQGATERSLGEFVGSLRRLVGSAGNSFDAPSCRAMLVSKLESGEHTPDGDLCTEHWWQEHIERSPSTVTFYDGDGGREHCRRYDTPDAKLLANIDTHFVPPAGHGANQPEPRPRALDIGCGSGQYAVELWQRGYDVDLLDLSQQMLHLAGDKLAAVSGLAPVAHHHDVMHLPLPVATASMDLVFACAVMIHVPRHAAPGVYREFARCLKPNGGLFINLKLRDHSLYSLDGRYFEYYADHEIAERMLREAGFEVEMVTFPRNRRNMYDQRVEINWVNFYCRRGEAR